MNSCPNKAADAMIGTLLVSLLHLSPGIGLIGLDLLDTDDGPWPAGPFDRVTNPARLSKSLSALAQRRGTVADWQAHLPALRAGYLPLLRLDTSAIAPQAGPFTALLAPAIDPSGIILGVVFVVFDDGPPRGAPLATLKAHAARVASQIAMVLDLCRLTSASLASSAA